MFMKTLPFEAAVRAFIVCVFTVSIPSTVFGQHGGSEQLIRVTWQDAKDKSLHWGEFVQVGPSIVFQNQGKVAGFPALGETQSLGPMKRIDNMLVLGVRGGQAGQPQGGWLAVDLQVFRIPANCWASGACQLFCPDQAVPSELEAKWPNAGPASQWHLHRFC